MLKGKKHRPLMSVMTVGMLFCFVVFSVVFGQSQNSFRNIAMAENKKLVTIYADGQKKTIATEAKTIGEALKQNNIQLHQGDVTEPASDTQINQPFYNVNVYRAYPSLVIDGDTKTKVISGYRSPRQVVTAANIKLYDEDKVSLDRGDNFVSEGVVGQIIRIDRAIPVNVIVGEKTFQFRTWKQTVGELLKEKNISNVTPEQLNVALDDKIYKDMKITINKYSQDVVQVNETIEPEVQYKDDPNEPTSYSKVITEGKAGQKLVSYLINQRNGQESSRQQIDVQVIIPAEPKIVVRGTRNDVIANNAELLYKLRMCETGGRYDANTGNGYYGAYQFSAATWNRWNTGYARADLAPPEVQDATVIKNTKASAGGFWSQHPGCSAKLGLPKFPY